MAVHRLFGAFWSCSLVWLLITGVWSESAADFTFSNTFQISQMAYAPSESGARASVSLILRPSVTLGSTVLLYVKLPDFSADGLSRTSENCATMFGGSGSLFDACNARINSLNKLLTISPADGVNFSRLVYFDADPGSSYYGFLVFQVVTLPMASETSVSVCCFYLPQASSLDNENIQISAITASNEVIVSAQAVKNSPELVRRNYFQALQIQFDPPVSQALASVKLIIQPAQAVVSGSRVLLRLPGVSRILGSSEKVVFTTASTDWLYFEYYASWDETEHLLTFVLREALAGGQRVTLITLPGEFKLPVSIEPNWEELTVGVRSGDLIDELVAETAVFQSDLVPAVLQFSATSLAYAFTTGGNADVSLQFSANKAIYKDTSIYVQLCGFQTSVTEVPLYNTHATSFRDMTGVFDLPSNVLTLVVSRTLYPDEGPFLVSFRNLVPPNALYANDPSLRISSSDRNAAYQQILVSPAVGLAGAKTFAVSRLAFAPKDPENPSQVTISLQPTVNLFEDTEIVLHLYGFKAAGSSLALSGEHASRFANAAAVWDAAKFELVLVVASEKVVPSDSVTEVVIEVGVGLRLPMMLSENDGILTIETRAGVVVFVEQIKSNPAVGEAKRITSSALSFSPAEANSVTKIEIDFTTNTNVLAGTLIYVKLGGLKRVVASGVSQTVVLLSGRNAPLFTESSSLWDAAMQTLTLELIDSVGILAGLSTSFFVEFDQGFTLPFAMYQNDPSLIISIPGAGIPSSAFQSTTQVNRLPKTFSASSLGYGDGEAPYPGALSSLQINFQPNTVLLEGSVVGLRLKGFSCEQSEIQLGPPLSNILDVTHRVFTPSTDGNKFYGYWDAATETLSLAVAPNQEVSNTVVTKIYLAKTAAKCRLPSSAALNDKNLTIRVYEGVIIYEEPIKTSPAILLRTFSASSLTYSPRQPLRTHQLTLGFTATVAVSAATPVVLTLTDFQNIDTVKMSVHLTGLHANLFVGESAVWDGSTKRITFTPLNPLAAGFAVSVKIEENQGFLLPASLYANDPRLMIASTANIPQESVKTSDLVGDGPYANQVYCMYLYEVGIRRTVQLLGGDVATMDTVDPCADPDLLNDTPQDFTVAGFNMYKEDKLGVVKYSASCPSVWATEAMLAVDTWQISAAADVDDNDGDLLGLSLLRYQAVRAVQTGTFRVCVLHNDHVYEIGKVVVRAGCPSPHVLNNGLCMHYCAVGKVPVFNECRAPSAAAAASAAAASAAAATARLMTLTLRYPAADSKGLANQPETDSSRQYFDFQFATELSDVLDIDPARVQILAISSVAAQTDVIVTTFVILPASTDVDIVREGDDRSPLQVAELLAALLEDKQSRLYWNALFGGVTAGTAGESLKVVQCGDGDYRTLCPVASDLQPLNKGVGTFVLGILLTVFSLLVVCMLAWRVDAGGDKLGVQRLAHVGTSEVEGLDPSIKAEFARSWLEGRYVEDPTDVRKRRQAAKGAKQ